MAYTARELITRSWYLSGIVSRSLQVPTGQQVTDGLFLLNALLDFKTIDTALIPYWTYYEFPAVVNQEKYFIPNLYAVETLTFNLGVVRYATDFTSRSVYFGSSRVDNISTLPFNWYFNREVDGGSIYLYFLPSDAFPIKIMGKFGLTNVTLDTDLLEIYDAAYIEYLRYALADYMCNEYNIDFPARQAKKLQEMIHELLFVSPPDLRTIKSSILTTATGINYGDINLGRGYRPS